MKTFKEMFGKRINESEDYIFIRELKSSEKRGGTARSRAMAKLSQDEPEGMITAYMPYGPKGRGFYYVKKGISFSDVG